MTVFVAAYAHAISSIGHSFATQYFTISRLPCSAAALIVIFIPLTLFLLSRPLEQLEFIRFSNFQQKYVSSNSLSSNSTTTIYAPTLLQSRYRRHLSHFKLPFQIPPRDDLLINFLVSLFTSYKNFKIGPIQSRKDVFETNIVVIHDQLPHVSLPNRLFCSSRPRALVAL